MCAVTKAGLAYLVDLIEHHTALCVSQIADVGDSEAVPAAFSMGEPVAVTSWMVMMSL